jgi:hypothetical protein
MMERVIKKLLIGVYEKRAVSEEEDEGWVEAWKSLVNQS